MNEKTRGHVNSTIANILIVDDNAVFAMELEEKATDLGYRVAGVASTSYEAIAMAESTELDLILMDIKMPGEIDGISAASRILQKKDAPIIFVTGHVKESLLERASQVSNYGYIVKPVHPGQLKGAIELALRKNNHHKNGSSTESVFSTAKKDTRHPITTKEHQIKSILSPSEYRVASLISDGKNSQEIATILNLSPRTVEWHRMNIRKKLSISDRKVSTFNLIQAFPT